MQHRNIFSSKSLHNYLRFELAEKPKLNYHISFFPRLTHGLHRTLCCNYLMTWSDRITLYLTFKIYVSYKIKKGEIREWGSYFSEVLTLSSLITFRSNFSIYILLQLCSIHVPKTSQNLCSIFEYYEQRLSKSGLSFYHFQGARNKHQHFGFRGGIGFLKERGESSLILKQSLKSQTINTFYTISFLYYPDLKVCCDGK